MEKKIIKPIEDNLKEIKSLIIKDEKIGKIKKDVLDEKVNINKTETYKGPSIIKPAKEMTKEIIDKILEKPIEIRKL